MKKLILCAVLMLAGQGFAASTSDMLLNLDAITQITLFLGFLAIGIGILSSGYALSISLGAYAACNKEQRPNAFIPAVMPGSQGIYSFAISFLMIQNVATMPLQVAFAGAICGLPCLFSALGQAKTAASCIKSISNGHMDQGQALLVTGVPELYALAGLAGAFLVMV
jgi:F0F1-type ATP synthase membrane subunit c/vacuolar-type H+-ATPase subunit K